MIISESGKKFGRNALDCQAENKKYKVCVTVDNKCKLGINNAKCTSFHNSVVKLMSGSSYKTRI